MSFRELSYQPRVFQGIPGPPLSFREFSSGRGIPGIPGPPAVISGSSLSNQGYSMEFLDPQLTFRELTFRPGVFQGFPAPGCHFGEFSIQPGVFQVIPGPEFSFKEFSIHPGVFQGILETPAANIHGIPVPTKGYSREFPGPRLSFRQLLPDPPGTCRKSPPL